MAFFVWGCGGVVFRRLGCVRHGLDGFASGLRTEAAGTGAAPDSGREFVALRMSNPAPPRRAAQQWFSLQHMAWLLDFDVSTVRRWWSQGRFGPPTDEDGDAVELRSSYWFTVGTGRGADVRISSRGYDFFLSQGSVMRELPVTARTEGEARRLLADYSNVHGD